MKCLYSKHIAFFLLFALLVGCGNTAKQKQQAAEETDQPAFPEFDADSAFQYIVAQCAFGPRVLESEAHERCGQYIASRFAQFGCQVSLQRAEFTRYDGLHQSGYNIIASTGGNHARRILICAHWDSRPWADQDADPAQWQTPIDAANDGASGVAVMLELARLIQRDSLAVGVDFVCFDAEDMGAPAWEAHAPKGEDDWCLGAQYWARHPPRKDFALGILLDMVAGEGARFYQEGFSKYYAPGVVEQVWQAALHAGFGDFFPAQAGGTITDDHVPVNRVAGIPTIDIIAYYPAAPNSFGTTWHTRQDNVEHISLYPLKAVGQTLVQLLYAQK